MSRSFISTLVVMIALTIGAGGARAAGYEGGWQEQLGYRNSDSNSSYDNSYSTPRVIHRVRHMNSGYTISRRFIATDAPCH